MPSCCSCQQPLPGLQNVIMMAQVSHKGLMLAFCTWQIVKSRAIAGEYEGKPTGRLLPLGDLLQHRGFEQDTQGNIRQGYNVLIR